MTESESRYHIGASTELQTWTGWPDEPSSSHPLVRWAIALGGGGSTATRIEGPSECILARNAVCYQMIKDEYASIALMRTDSYRKARAASLTCLRRDVPGIGTGQRALHFRSLKRAYVSLHTEERELQTAVMQCCKLRCVGSSAVPDNSPSEEILLLARCYQDCYSSLGCSYKMTLTWLALDATLKEKVVKALMREGGVPEEVINLTNTLGLLIHPHVLMYPEYAVRLVLVTTGEAHSMAHFGDVHIASVTKRITGIKLESMVTLNRNRQVYMEAWAPTEEVHNLTLLGRGWQNMTPTVITQTAENAMRCRDLVVRPRYSNMLREITSILGQ